MKSKQKKLAGVVVAVAAVVVVAAIVILGGGKGSLYKGLLPSGSLINYIYPDDSTAGVTTNYMIHFVPTQDIPAKGQLRVDFPPDINLLDSGASFGGCEVAGVLAPEVYPFTFKVKNLLPTPHEIEGKQTVIVCHFNNIKNPTAGLHGPFSISSLDADGNTIEKISGLTITFFDPPPPGAPVDSIMPQSLAGNTTNKVDVYLMGKGMTISTDAHIVITFPGEFDLSPIKSASCGLAVGGNLNGGFTFARNNQSVTITRVDQPGISTSNLDDHIHCVLDSVKNLYTGAVSGNFKISVYNEDYSRTEYDNQIVAGVTITTPAAGTVFSTDAVAPQSLVGDSTNKVDVTLMGKGTTISTDAHIIITFPSQFDLSALKSASCGLEVGGNLNGGFTFARNSQSVTITRVDQPGISTSNLDDHIHCVLDSVKNLYTGAVSGNFKISVYNEDYTKNEYDNQTVPGVTITAPAVLVPTVGTLTNTSVSLESSVANDTGLVTVEFKTVNMFTDGKVQIKFPPDFDLTNATLSTCRNLDGTLNLTKAPAESSLYILKTGARKIAPLTTVTCVFGGIKNPSAVGPTGKFGFLTINPVGTIIDQKPDVNGVTITAPATASVSLTSLVAGETPDVTFRLTTAKPLAGGKLKFTVPTGFDITGATLQSGNCRNLTGTVTVATNVQTITLTRSAAAVTTVGTDLTCAFTGIKNSTVAGPTGQFTVGTYSDADALIEEVKINGVTLTPGAAPVQNASIVNAQATSTAITVKVADLHLAAAERYLVECLRVSNEADVKSTNVAQPATVTGGTVDVVVDGLTPATAYRCQAYVGVPAGAALNKTRSSSPITVTTLPAATTPTNPGNPGIADQPKPPVIIAPANQCGNLVDVMITDPDCPAIKYAQFKNVMVGYPDNTFQKYAIISRVETAKVALLAAGKQVPMTPGTIKDFPDSDPGAWYYPFVHTAKVLGVLLGYPDGFLRPTQQVNRVEMLAIFFRAMGKNIASIRVVGDKIYDDAPASEWYARILQYNKNHALVDSLDGKLFYPAAGMRRGDVAQLYYRYHLAGLLPDESPQNGK